MEEMTPIANTGRSLVRVVRVVWAIVAFQGPLILQRASAFLLWFVVLWWEVRVRVRVCRFVDLGFEESLHVWALPYGDGAPTALTPNPNPNPNLQP